jgi:hypothetical protein
VLAFTEAPSCPAPMPRPIPDSLDPRSASLGGTAEQPIERTVATDRIHTGVLMALSSSTPHAWTAGWTCNRIRLIPGSQGHKFIALI